MQTQIGQQGVERQKDKPHLPRNQLPRCRFPVMLDMIKSNPQYEWVSLQVDASPEEESILSAEGVKRYPGAIKSFADTAALIMAMDVVIGVDTAISHLSGALGRPTWIMLNWFATDWRWLTKRDDSPWYSTARLFRQPAMGDWATVVKRINLHLKLFKI